MASIAEKLMKSHDWFYEYADSNQEYFKGKSERRNIYLEYDKLNDDLKKEALYLVPEKLKEEFLTEYRGGAWRRFT